MGEEKTLPQMPLSPWAISNFQLISLKDIRKSKTFTTYSTEDVIVLVITTPIVMIMTILKAIGDLPTMGCWDKGDNPRPESQLLLLCNMHGCEMVTTHILIVMLARRQIPHRMTNIVRPEASNIWWRPQIIFKCRIWSLTVKNCFNLEKLFR